jgi:hypothetical protein
MKRIPFVVGLVMVQLGVLVSAQTPGAPPQDALTMLRAALGGDTALAAIQTIRARGTIENKRPAVAQRRYDDHFEVALALPDRFVRTVRSLGNTGYRWSIDETRSSDGIGWPTKGEVLLVGGTEDTTTTVTGFNREMPLPAPTWYENDRNPEYVAPRLDNAHAQLAEFLLPLMGATPASYPVVARSEAYAITFSAVGGREWRLELDPVTHLPARMTWAYTLPSTPPGAGSLQIYNNGGVSRSYALISTPPATAKLRRMQIDFSDFRVVGGLRWPHQLSTYRDGIPVEDVTVNRYDVNVKLSDKMFRK